VPVHRAQRRPPRSSTYADDGVAGRALAAVVAVRADVSAEGHPAVEAERIPGQARREVLGGHLLHHALHDPVSLVGICVGKTGRPRASRSTLTIVLAPKEWTRW
jgi:hypothetical protein